MSFICVYCVSGRVCESSDKRTGLTGTWDHILTPTVPAAARFNQPQGGKLTARESRDSEVRSESISVRATRRKKPEVEGEVGTGWE